MQRRPREGRRRGMIVRVVVAVAVAAAVVMVRS